MFGKTSLLQTIHLGVRKQKSMPRHKQEAPARVETPPEVSASSDLPVLLNAIVRRACTLLNLASGALYLLRSEEGMFETVAGYRVPANWVGKKFQMGDGLASQVVQAKKPLSAQDYLAECKQECIPVPAWRTAGIPVFVNGEVVGVMVLIDPEVGMFNDEEMRLMGLFAQQAAAVIEMQDQMQEMVVIDPLTGLFNRLFFDTELARLDLGGYFPVSIIVADVSNLKATNERLGHAMRDELLRNVAQVLQRTFRTGDKIARVGEDEFAVLLPQTGLVMAKQMLVRVQVRLAEYNRTHPELPIQISLGTSTAQQGELTEALIAVDQHMYSHLSIHKSPYLEKFTLAIPHSATSAA